MQTGAGFNRYDPRFPPRRGRLTPRQMSDRISDHFPLWIEFITDRSTEAMARTLGLNPGFPDPLSTVPD